MHRILLAGLVLTLTARMLPAQYQAGPAPTADISHVTVEAIPGPTSRLTIGIKEQVACSISNWQDTDLRTVASTTINVSDNYGTINWVAGSGTCNPTTGPSTTYSAPESDVDTCDSLTMTADDSPLGDDSPIDVFLTFDIRVPTGHDATKDSDLPYPNEGMGMAKMGARTYFWPQVLPTSVSFKNVNFRENYAQQVMVWPNGDTLTFGPDNHPWNVAVRNGAPNVWTVKDQRFTGQFPVTKLLKNGANQDCLLVYSVPWEFQANGSWVEFTDPPGFDQFYGGNLKAKASFDTQYGSLQGPYP